MKEPVLLIMAAGMGSRFGGLKQMEPVGPNQEWILEYSLFDAWKAGFQEAILVIRKENEALMKQLIDERIGDKAIKISYAYQELENIPKGKRVPEGRTKPWGTGQAVLSAKEKIQSPFAVINADDYYGQEAFTLVYNHLKQIEKNEENDFAMVGYQIKNTLTESGYVSRGVCEVAKDGKLKSIVERVHIIQTVDGPMYSEDMENYIRLNEDTVVSMNMWGFTTNLLQELEKSFLEFFDKEVETNPLKSEFFLPFAVEALLKNHQATVKVFTTEDKWYGVTYKEDVKMVKEALQRLHDQGRYPQNFGSGKKTIKTTAKVPNG
ncbi:MAG: nucleotidyltransferase [Clostridiales bacterium]|nr:nucleotidyltransferase [Clostridiales bacterium]